MRASEPPTEERPSAYAKYALGVLVIVYVFNFLDRQILSILAERIKADLHLGDADMGFLYGTAFAVFYAVFGIPLGRLADVWDRRKLISVGLAVWSAMTALSGLSRNFGELGAARIGVGVGEASASPAAYSLLPDYFPKRLRATVLAIYSSGIYIGAGIGIFLGGLIVDRWEHAFAQGTAPFGLKGWQVAFFVVGVPGLVLAALVASLREPPRGGTEGMTTSAKVKPLAVFARELAAVLPPLTLWSLASCGVGAAGLLLNLGIAAALALLAWSLSAWLGTPVQWWSLCAGIYCVASWAQSLRRRDKPAFTLIFETPSLRWVALGFAFAAFSSYAFGFWTAPYFVRVLKVNLKEAGILLGLTAAFGGFLGTTAGGLLADRLRVKSPRGRLYAGLLAALFPLPFAVTLLLTQSVTVAYAMNFFTAFFGSMWLGPGASTVTELVLPRMRGAVTAAYFIVINFIGMAMGPYTVGRVSMSFGHLRPALLVALGANAVAAVCLLLARRTLVQDEATRSERAAQAGETSAEPRFVPVSEPPLAPPSQPLLEG